MSVIRAAVVSALLLLAGAAPATAAPAPPPANAPFDYQLGGAPKPPADARIVERDRSARPAPGTYGVCYVNAFQAQPEAAAWWKARHRDLLLRRHGTYVIDRDWHELVLDTSTGAKRAALAAIVGRWIDGCATAGYRAVEPDNLDSWTRSQGRLTRAEATAFAALLVARAHARGLAIAQKNTPELGAAGKALGFDFAVAEECQAYHECGAYTRVYGDEVFEVEYVDNGGLRGFRAACAARGARISITYRDRDLLPAGRRGHVARSC